MTHLPQPLQKALQWAIKHDKGLLAMGAGVNDLTAIYPYHQDGKEVFVKVRFDKDGKKWIKPFYFDGNKYRLGEPKLPKKPLYTPALLGDVVYLVEGEKCTDWLTDIGLSATTTGASGSVGKCDLTPLQGHKCVLWRDNDEAGESWQSELITALNALTIAYEVIDIAQISLPTGERLPNKGDCVDFIDAHLQDGLDDDSIKALIENLPRLALTPPPQIDRLAQDESRFIETIAELASLSQIQLDLALPKVAKEFGINQDKVQSYVNEHKKGQLVKATTPYHKPVAGSEIFGELYQMIDAFIFIDDGYKTAFVLWVISSYLVQDLDFAPHAWITAPERNCGKSTLLELFQRVVDRPFTMIAPTMATVFRIMDKYRPTLLLDEIDTNLKTKSEILGLINGGYSKVASLAPRINTNKGNELDLFNVYGAKVFCGIGTMQGTFASRAIRFNLTRQPPYAQKPLLNSLSLPLAKTELLKQKIKRWCEDNRQSVLDVDVKRLAMDARINNNWQGLFKIAQVLGVYDKALIACQTVNKITTEPTFNEMLLGDIKDKWQGQVMTIRQIHTELVSDETLPWQSLNKGQPITVHWLGKQLRKFDIHPTPKDLGKIQGIRVQGKGYDKAQFEKIWEIYT